MLKPQRCLLCVAVSLCHVDSMLDCNGLLYSKVLHGLSRHGLCILFQDRQLHSITVLFVSVLFFPVDI